jgi:hypothetical protein
VETKVVKVFWRAGFFEQGSGNQEGNPTQRALDGGYAPRFLSVFLALGFSRFDASPPPTHRS